LSGRAAARRYDSVQQDWRAFLPYAKASLFTGHTEQLEHAYVMFSVSLNEAINYKRKGDSAKAGQGLRVVGELCAHLALRINAVLHAMRQYGRHFGVVPNLALLDSDNFHSDCGHRAARTSNLVSRVLLSERSQFLNKLNTLEEIVDELGDEVIETCRQLARGMSPNESQMWEFLDLGHFDLNTCLRETDVLLKSFLLVLPEDQLARFDFTVCGLSRARRPDTSSSPDLIRPRRIAAVAGE
jgi:hypothetical protein